MRTPWILASLILLVAFSTGCEVLMPPIDGGSPSSTSPNAAGSPASTSIDESTEVPTGEISGPYIENIDSESGAPGTTVTLTGIGFNQIFGIQLINFGGVNAERVSWSDTEIVAKVPHGIGSVEITVGPFPQSNSVAFTYREPRVESIVPSHADPGEIVIIRGAHFGSKGLSPSFRVKFGNSLAKVRSWDDDQLVVEVPTDYGTGIGNAQVVARLVELSIAGWTEQLPIEEFVDIVTDLLDIDFANITLSEDDAWWQSFLKIMAAIGVPGVDVSPDGNMDVAVAVKTPAGESNLELFTYMLPRTETASDGIAAGESNGTAAPSPDDATTSTVPAENSCVVGRDVIPLYFVDVLSHPRLDIPVSQLALNALAQWAAYENTNACWNPLATTWGEPGSTEFNDAGVQNYADRTTGIHATASTLGTANSVYNYASIRSFFELEMFDKVAIKSDLAAWIGETGYASSVADEWQMLWNSQQSSTEPTTGLELSCWGTDPLTSSQLADLVKRHFTAGTVSQTGDDTRVTAYAIARAESGGNPTACGDSNQSFGLWQIHVPSHPEYDRAFLFSPDNNANAAVQISRDGRDWNAWCTWEESACGGVGNGRYLGYIDEARTALGIPAPLDTTAPIVDSFSVSPKTLTLGGSFTIFYTVSDTGGSGLNRVELQRAPDSGGNPGIWERISVQTASGNISSGSFSDTPPNAGIYWYGIHAVDGRENRAYERSPLQAVVETIPDTTAPIVVLFSVSTKSLAMGDSIIISYTVSDTGGSGLDRVELQRAPDDEGHAGIWAKIDELPVSGDSDSGSFIDTPPDAGIYWYGVHVVDTNENRATERTPLQIVVEAIPDTIADTTGDVFGAGVQYCASTYDRHTNYFGGGDVYTVVDLNQPYGTPTDLGRPLYAPAAGTVTLHSKEGGGTGWGNSIIWESTDGKERLQMAHLGDFGDTGLIASGDSTQVIKGTFIGRVGETHDNKGEFTGPHLHISRSIDGKPVTLELSGVLIVPHLGDQNCEYHPDSIYTSNGQITDGALPDLTISAQVGSNYQAGQTNMVIPVTVTRSGGDLSSGEWVLARLYWSNDGIWDPADALLWDSHTAGRDIFNASLNASGAKTVIADIEVPAVSTEGTYYVIAYVDPPTGDYPDTFHAESNENNNIRVYPVSVETPTLAVSLTASPSSGPVPLNGVDLTAAVSGTATGTINYTFYCDRSDSGTDIAPDWNVKFDGVLVNPKTAEDACDYPAPGTYTVKVIVERGTTDPVEARAVITVGALPDLTISAQVGTSYQAGQTDVTIPVTVSLSGGGLTRGEWVLAGLYWSSDTTWDPTDVVLWDSHSSGSEIFNAALDSNGSVTVTNLVDFPNVSSDGTYYIIAYVDPPTGEYPETFHAESNENNNTMVYPVSVVAAVVLLDAPSLSNPLDVESNVSAKPSFSWSPVSGATRYWLMISTSESALPTDVNVTTCSGCVLNVYTSLTNYIPSVDLANSATYYWKVQAFNDSVDPVRQGKYSTVRNFTTEIATVTLTLYVRDGSASGPVISGAQVIGQDAAGTSFSAVTNSIGYVTIGGAPGMWSFTASKTGFVPVSWSQSITVTGEKHAFLSATATVSSAPLYLSATAGDGSVALSWSAPSDDGGSTVTNYKIYRGTYSGGETLYYTTSTAGTTFNNTANVTNGDTYYYKVRAVNAVGESEFSGVVIATPTAAAVTLTLYVRDGSASGPVISGAQVIGQDAAGTSFSAVTNSIGYVTISGVPGTWSFTASKTGYESVSWSQSITVNGVKHAFLQVTPDTTAPVVGSFSVSPGSLTQGGSFTISYSVSDSGGSGLNRIELWRAGDSGGSPIGWIEIKRTYVSGNSYSGTFSDAPSSVATYWYGVHVVDNANSRAPEDSPVRVEVTAATVTLTLYVHNGSAGGPVLSGVSVSGQDATGSSFFKTTNASGYIVVTGVPGTWSFAASKTGYESVSWSQSITVTGEKHAFLKVTPDTTAPVVGSFSVSPGSLTQGGSFTISYSVSDSGGSGLNRIELWRADDSGGSPTGWIEIQRTYVSGNSYAGAFSDVPPSAVAYWYGVHVVDNANSWAPEGSPFRVEVTAATVTLTLYVRDGSASGPVISGAQVTGQDAAGTSFSAFTNSSGYVTISGAPGTWSFTASKTGYESVSWSQSITVNGVKHAFLQVTPDTTAPVVGSFSVSPGSLTQGGSFTISYSVSDSGGSGLNRVELKRAPNNGGNPGSWEHITTISVSGFNTSGSLANTPLSAGVYWYGMHVIDNAGNRTTENAPVRVEVTAATVTLTLYVHNGSAGGPVLSGVSVSGQDATGSSFSKTTNASGYIVVTGVPGTWSFAASKTGFVPVSWSQSITVTGEKHAFLLMAATFQLNERVRTTTNLNVRTGAGTGYSEISDPDYIGYAPSGAIGTVLDGPISANGYTWWRVQFDGGYTGWCVDYWLEKV